MDFDPSVMSAVDRYKLLIGGIVPRPIAWVSTVSPDGRLNLAPFSFFAGVGATPMSVVFCPANKDDGTAKDTLLNAAPASHPLQGTGEFVVNIVPQRLARQMAACAEPLAYGESEFELAGLQPAASARVKPPRVAESPLSFECETMQVIRLAPGEPGGANLVIGRVVHVHAAEGLVNERHHIDPAMLDAIGRMSGVSYCTTRERFEVPMGRGALKGG